MMLSCAQNNYSTQEQTSDSVSQWRTLSGEHTDSSRTALAAMCLITVPRYGTRCAFHFSLAYLTN